MNNDVAQIIMLLGVSMWIFAFVFCEMSCNNKYNLKFKNVASRIRTNVGCCGNDYNNGRCRMSKITKKEI